MPTATASLVSLQAPKDVSLGQIEAELSQIFQMYNAVQEDGSSGGAMRAATFTLAIYEPEETQQLLAALRFYRGPVDGIRGPQTEAAIRAAQKAYNLTVDGHTGPELLAQLRQALRQQEASQATNGNGAGDRGDGEIIAAGHPSAMADAIASQNPCRIISLFPTAEADTGVTAQVSAYCPLHKRGQNTLICCEYITLNGAESALSRVSGLVNSLLIAGLPKFLWWKATPQHHPELLRQLANSFDCLIFDSNHFTDPIQDLMYLQTLIGQKINLIDLNWRRLAAWQELTAEAYDPPERWASLQDIDQVTIDYEKGNPAQALMFLGWLASRLNWRPSRFQSLGGDYDIYQIQFTGANQQLVTAELAAIPTGTAGDVIGDLIDLKLTSSNPKANCNTIICSETGGCMRMESGGGAQNARTFQVSSLTDQNAEALLGQQLQRWGRDVLFEESLAVTAAILGLSAT
jgi:glucose-6-phosphate dehydrogenase assembly protein OpcA